MSHFQRQQIIEHLASKQPRTDPQKAEIQQRRNDLARRIKLWKTAQVVYMPQAPDFLPDEQHSRTFDPDEFEESKPELWPLLLPSELTQDDRSSSYTGIVGAEQSLRLAQAQDNLVDLRRLRRTLRSLRTYFRLNVVGEGQKTQTRSRASESGVTLRISRAVRRYRLAYIALLSLDPTGDWRKEYLELTDKDNRGPGKESQEQGVGDGYYTMSWIWGGSFGSEADGEDVSETVRHEWMTCRARADRWREELDLLQEEMRRVIAFLEWKSSSWAGRVGSRSGSVTVDIQHGIDSYARKQASIYRGLAVSLARQWIPHLITLELDISWTKSYSWAAEIVSLAAGKPSASTCMPSGSTLLAKSGEKRSSTTEPANFDHGSGDEKIDGSEGGDVSDEGEDSDGLEMGFEYDDHYMS